MEAGVGEVVHGLAELDEGPANLHPAERVCHGWQTLDFQANQEWGAQKVPFTELMDAIEPASTALQSVRKSNQENPSSEIKRLTAPLLPNYISLGVLNGPRVVAKW